MKLYEKKITESFKLDFLNDTWHRGLKYLGGRGIQHLPAHPRAHLYLYFRFYYCVTHGSICIIKCYILTRHLNSFNCIAAKHPDDIINNPFLYS